MTKKIDDARIETGVRNLDAVFGGGLPKGSATVIAGAPGSGKTIVTQQMCFHNATTRHPALYFSTLSEPTAKTLRYLRPFSFFDAEKIGTAVQFHDLGGLLRENGLEAASRLIMEKVREVKPSIVVIDSFKALEDFASSKEELRKFSYELAVNLMAWEATTFLLGEYGDEDVHTSPLFSIVDGLIVVSQREQAGEQQRFLQIVKMRGADHSRDEHAFLISDAGIEVFAPRVTIVREDRGAATDRLKTGITNLDAILGEGIPRGSSLLVGGVAGTGKTILLLEFLYRGALAGEKGIIFSFEETTERLRASARGMGWDFDRELDRGMIEIVFIPQPEIMVEKHLLMMQERVETFQARRVAIDSVSVFLHKLQDPRIAREKTFQLASIVQNSQAVGFFATDIPYGSGQISRFGVEETVVDGVLLLTSTEEDMERRRYLEVYKLRNTAHLKGRHSIVIGNGGIALFPRYNVEADLRLPPPPLEPSRRLSSGVPGLDGLLGGGLLERSATLVSGSTGIGKSTFGLHFIVEGAQRNEPGLYVSLEEGPAQLLQSAAGLGLPLGELVEQGSCHLVFLSREEVRASQVLSILSDLIEAKGIQRLVLDGVSQIEPDGNLSEGLQRLLAALVARFKTRGVTSVLTVEAKSLYPTGTITEGGFSLVADNIILLRYLRVGGEDRPSISVVKTRGSAHDRGTYHFSIAMGGIQIEECVAGGMASPPEPAGRKKRPGKT